MLAVSCSNNYIINVSPEDADLYIEGQPYVNGDTYVSKESAVIFSADKIGYTTFQGELKKQKEPIEIVLEKKKFSVSLESVIKNKLENILGKSELYINGEKSNSNSFKGDLEYGSYKITFKKRKFPDFTFSIFIDKDEELLIRHPEIYKPGTIKLSPMGIYSCGHAPKQVNISPDNRYIYIPLLGGNGFEVFDKKTKKIIGLFGPEEFAEKEGFVEGLFIPEKNTFLVSQMNTSNIYEYDVSDPGAPVFKRTIPAKGVWTKVIAYNKEINAIAASNWDSQDVSIIDYTSGKVTHQIKNLITPRGLMFSSDGKYLYIATFDGGTIHKYSTAAWKEKGKILVEKGSRKAAMRHIRISLDDSKIYVSDMMFNKIYEVDTASFKIAHTYSVGINTNSIDITEDGRYIYVSNRGPNNPESYLKKSLTPGTISILDLQEKKVIGTITGGTQPTGLDISPDGSYFVFSNFQDHTIELYAINQE